MVIRHLYSLRSDHLGKSSTHPTPMNYYTIIDYIPWAVLYIPVTIEKCVLSCLFFTLSKSFNIIAN